MNIHQILSEMKWDNQWWKEETFKYAEKGPDNIEW